MRYTEEQLQALRDRWKKPLLRPGSFTRDEDGKVTGGEPQPINEKGWVWETDKFHRDNIKEVNNIITFLDLLTTNLIYLEKAYLPEIKKIKKDQKENELREKYQKVWVTIGEKILREVFLKLDKYGLDSFNGGVDFRGAVCIKACFIGADFYEVDFSGANCKNAGFSYCLLNSASFESAKLTGALFDSAGCDCVNFENTESTAVNFEKIEANCAVFDNAVLHFSGFKKAKLYQASFNGAQFDSTKFEGADCRCASFSFKEKILQNNEIERKQCNLTGISFDMQTNFVGVDTSSVDWSKNPRLKRFIEQQQFVHSMKERFDNWGKLRFAPNAVIDLLDYLSGFGNWLMWATIAILFFAMLYGFCGDGFKPNEGIEYTPITPIYFSVVIFSTLGLSSITPITWVTQLLVIIEVITGYVFLGGLVTFLGNWLGRR